MAEYQTANARAVDPTVKNERPSKDAMAMAEIWTIKVSVFIAVFLFFKSKIHWDRR